MKNTVHLSGEEQYLNLCRRIIEEGDMIYNTRTGKGCLTVINADFEYDTANNAFPILTTRKIYWKQAIAEMLGYLKGYDNAQQFSELGCYTWFANADKNKKWLDNPHRKGDGDLGRVYGVQGRSWRNPEGKEIDQYKTIITKLNARMDDRALIMTFHNPGELDRGCLNSCMHTHHFSLIGDTLHLTSYQRSVDVPLGLSYNMLQTVLLLRLTARITGLKAGKVYHKMVNCHIYEDQLGSMKTIQLQRTPLAPSKLYIDNAIQTLQDIDDLKDTSAFSVEGYKHHVSIKYAFSV